MARTLTRKQKSRINKAKFRLAQRRKHMKRACVGKARTKAGRRRKARSTKCRYHKSRLPKNKRALKRARKGGRKGARKSSRRAKTRRNPATVSKHLKGGGEIVISGSGSSVIVRGYDRSGDMIYDESMSYDAAVALAKRIKTTSALENMAEKASWSMLAMDNPRRRKTRRNCGTMRNAPISKRDLSALRRVVATHARGRGRKFVR